MKTIIHGLLFVFMSAQVFAQNSGTEQEIIKLSKEKWQWMADKNVDKLKDLFDDKSVFVHMGGSWGKERELEVIGSGGIHYKKADIHEASVNIIGNTAILLNRITLLAVVGGNEVTNPFMVTEVYVKENGGWKLGSLILHQTAYTWTIKNKTMTDGLKQILLGLFFFTSICSACQMKELGPEKNSPSETSKVLIVYLSRTNNTKAIAEIIQEQVGGTLVALELKNPYPEDYKAIVDQVVKENESGFLPPLKTKIDSIQKYDVVFVGFPTWGMQLPPPMKSFLNQYDLSGKTIVPFNTNAGYGIGSTFDTVKKLCPKSTVLEGFSTKGGVERDGIYFVMEGEKKKQAKEEIKKWLKKLSLMQK